MKLDRQDFISWMELKNLKVYTMYFYILNFDKLEPATNLNQEIITRFIERHNNGVTRAFIKNLIQYMAERKEQLKLSLEEIERVRSIILPKITGRKKVRIPRIISEEEVMRIAEQQPIASSERNKIMLFLSYFCGFRVGELIKIKPLDFNWVKFAADPESMGELTVYGKGDKQALAIVPAELMIRINRWIYNECNMQKVSKNERLFPGTRTWQLILAKASMRALGFKVYPHLLRHSIATNLLNSGKVNIADIKEFLRHSSIASTEIYLHLSKEDLKKKYMEAFS